MYLHTFLTSVRDGGDSQLHAPAALPAEKDPRYPQNGRMCGPQGSSGISEEETFPAFPGSRTNFPVSFRQLHTYHTH